MLTLSLGCLWWRSHGIDLIFTFLSTLFQWILNVRITPFLVVLRLNWFFKSKIHWVRKMGSQHKNIKSIFRDDHRQIQSENFKLKRNGFFPRIFSSFRFAIFLVAFIVLWSNGSHAVQYIRNTLIFLFAFTYFHGAFNFRWNDSIPLLSTRIWTRESANVYPPSKQNLCAEEYFERLRPFHVHPKTVWLVSADLNKCYWNPKRKLGLTTHFSKIIKQQYF